MSATPNTTPTPSNFDALFRAALAKYTNQTGKDLRNHPLAHQMDRCATPESLLALFQGQAQTFDEFRNGDHRLIKCLQPVVKCLHALSTSAALCRAVSVVSP